MRRSFVKRYNSFMRWFYWFIYAVVLTGISILVFSLFFRHTNSATVNILLQGGDQVRVTASWVDRGWMLDANDYSLKLSTQAAAGQDTPLRFAARLEMGGLEMTPKGISERSITAGGSTAFTWQAKAYRAGVTPGVLWLFVLDDSGAQTAIYAKEFNLNTYDYLGFSPKVVRPLAGAFILLGSGSIWLGQRKGKNKPVRKAQSKTDSELANKSKNQVS
jgi:hypothetical protein